MAASSPSLDQALKAFKTYFDNPVTYHSLTEIIQTSDTTKLSLSRKRDLLDLISAEMPTLSKRALTCNYQLAIVQTIMHLSSYGCGASLQRAMLSILIFVYTQGDFTKMQSEFFEACLLQLGNEKHKMNSLMKVNLCHLSSKIFKALWARCHTPPTKELVETYFKIIKNSGTEVSQC